MFPKKCRFKGCSVDSSTDPDNISLFRFPVKNRDRCLEWILRSGNDDFVELSDSQLQEKRICSLHFSKDVFLNVKRNRLANFAVPFFYSIPDDADQAESGLLSDLTAETAPTNTPLEEEIEHFSHNQNEDECPEMEAKGKPQRILLQAVTQKAETPDTELKNGHSGSHKVVVQILPQKITLDINPEDIKLKAHQYIELQVDLQNVILKFAKIESTSNSS